MKDYSKYLIGLSGELSVARILCEKNYVPTLANNNCPTFDVFCFDPKTQKTIAIQIKTTKNEPHNKKSSFSIMGNRDNRSDFYENISGPFVFVIRDIHNNYRYFILSKEQFISISSKVEDDYDNLIRAKPIKPGSPMALPIKCILNFEDQWDNLWV